MHRDPYIADMIAAHRSGVSIAKLASIYGMGDKTVSKIVTTSRQAKRGLSRGGDTHGTFALGNCTNSQCRGSDADKRSAKSLSLPERDSLPRMGQTLGVFFGA
jgi:hypothetical protein